MRINNYSFENLDSYLKDEGYNEIIVQKMKEIIKAVKDKCFLKQKIFNFIINVSDFFKDCPDKFIKELDIILNQVKLDFKEMVRKNVLDTEDVRNFIESENSSYYNQNNNRNNKVRSNYSSKSEIDFVKKTVQTNYINQKTENTENNSDNNNIPKKGKKWDNNENKDNITTDENTIDKELELYDNFKIKSYEPSYQNYHLNISNTFIANNNNNNYIEENTSISSKNNTTYIKETNNYYETKANDNKKKVKKKKNIFRTIDNVDKKNEKHVSIYIDSSNEIRANNGNNNEHISTSHTTFVNNTTEANVVNNYYSGNCQDTYIEHNKNSDDEDDGYNFFQNEINKKTKLKKKIIIFICLMINLM